MKIWWAHRKLKFIQLPWQPDEASGGGCECGMQVHSCAPLQAEETAKRNEELRQRAEARIAAALAANAAALHQRRAAFGEKQALTEERAM